MSSIVSVEKKLASHGESRRRIWAFLKTQVAGIETIRSINYENLLKSKKIINMKVDLGVGSE